MRTIARRMSNLPDALASFGQIAGVVLGAPARRSSSTSTARSPRSSNSPVRPPLAPGADKALRSLAALYPVAVLSGRDLADIREQVGIPGLWYAGSHGFEMVGPGRGLSPQQ